MTSRRVPRVNFPQAASVAMVTKPRFFLPDDQKCATGEPQDGGLAARVGRNLSDWKSATTEGLGRHPALTVVAGIALGVALGWLLKRR